MFTVGPSRWAEDAGGAGGGSPTGRDVTGDARGYGSPPRVVRGVDDGSSTSQPRAVGLVPRIPRCRLPGSVLVRLPRRKARGRGDRAAGARRGGVPAGCRSHVRDASGARRRARGLHARHLRDDARRRTRERGGGRGDGARAPDRGRAEGREGRHIRDSRPGVRRGDEGDVDVRRDRRAHRAEPHQGGDDARPARLGRVRVCAHPGTVRRRRPRRVIDGGDVRFSDERRRATDGQRRQGGRMRRRREGGGAFAFGRRTRSRRVR